MNYTYSSITRVLSIQHNGRVKTYSDINLFGIEACPDCVSKFYQSYEDECEWLDDEYY